MYTRTANAEKIYIKDTNKYEIFNRKYQESYLNKLNTQNCTKYKNDPHEELPAHNRASTQWRTQEFCSVVGQQIQLGTERKRIWGW